MESITIGSTVCDFITESEVHAVVTQWLASQSLHHIVTLNPEMVVEADRNPDFAAAVAAADMRIPDGSGIFWAREYLRSHQAIFFSLVTFMRTHATPVTGVDTLLPLVRLAAAAGQSIYLLGGTPAQARSTAQYLQKEISTSRIHVGPAHTFDSEGPTSVLTDIQRKAPGLLLVAYGAPNQSVWIERHRGSLPSVRVAVGIGGAFAMIGGQTPRAPKFLRKHHLEWAWRLMQQPRRLPRIWRAVISFPNLIHQQKRGKVGVDD